MNKRRWAAVIIALALFVFSTIMVIKDKEATDESSSSLTGINALLFGSGELEESVSQEGDEDERIVELTVDGTIQDTGESSIFSDESYNHQFFMEQLKAVQHDSSIAGVLLTVNSPGGGVYESAEIAKEIRKIQAKKIPVYVSMKNMAASGGYYISASADKIFATDETMTGSIGVIMSSLNYADLFKKLGISDQTYKSGALKDMGSASRKPTKEDEKVLQEFIDSSYNRFVKIVSSGRDMNEAQVKKIADGRIYDGQQAKKNGLIDQLGFPEDALKALEKDHNLSNAQVFQYDKLTSGFGSTWLGSKIAEIKGVKPTEQTRLLQLVEKIGTPQAPKPMYYYGGE